VVDRVVDRTDMIEAKIHLRSRSHESVSSRPVIVQARSITPPDIAPRRSRRAICTGRRKKKKKKKKRQ